MQSIYSKRLFYLLLFIVLLKILIAGLIELGNDEVYYYTYALQPDWNHFDHPPMVGVLIRFTTLNLYWLNEVSMRLGAVLGCAVSSWFIFLTGKSIGSERTGWYAALIYNCSVYTGIIAGLFILPDSPQMPFWTASLYLMSRIVFKEEDKKTVLWLLMGLMIGLASLSKVHGLYLWGGFGLFMLIKRTKWLLNWRMYAGAIITAVCIIPIVYWNIKNNFITYKFHSERVTHHSIQWDSLLREILGEFAYQNPVVFVLLVVSLLYLIRNKKILYSLANIWLLCMSIPMILLFWGVALFNPTLPHWSGPAYIPLFIIAARYLESRAQKAYPSFIKIAGGLVISLLIFATAFVRLAPFNIGSQKAENFGEYCPTLDLSGWSNFSDAFTKLEKEDIANGSMKPNSPIIINKWFPGGHLEFYTARKSGLPVIGIGNLEDLHKFAWLNKSGEQLHLGDDAYCIVASNMPADPTILYKDYFTTIEQPVLINQVRSSAVVRFFYVYRLKQCKNIPEPILP